MIVMHFKIDSLRTKDALFDYNFINLILIEFKMTLELTLLM